MIRKFLKSVLIFLFFLIYSYGYADPETFFFDNNQDKKRFYALGNEIRCVVCQNQSINESQAPLAQDLRQKVYQMIKEKKSDEDIKNYLVKRYGEFILFKPRFNQLTLLLWLFPFCCLGLFFTWFYRVMKSAKEL